MASASCWFRAYETISGLPFWVRMNGAYLAKGLNGSFEVTLLIRFLTSLVQARHFQRHQVQFDALAGLKHVFLDCREERCRSRVK